MLLFVLILVQFALTAGLLAMFSLLDAKPAPIKSAQSHGARRRVRSILG
ncbi:MAG: hypothetical protein AB7U38_11965 [Hyphomicrobiales bacterium]